MVIHGLKSSKRVICKDRKGALANYSSHSWPPGYKLLVCKTCNSFQQFQCNQDALCPVLQGMFLNITELASLKVYWAEKRKETQMDFFSICLSNSFGKDPRENQCEEKHLL